MKLRNPFLNLTKFEWALWLCSLLVITVSLFAGGTSPWYVIVASLIGATGLIFVSKGDVLGQILTVGFSIFYSVISLTFNYYGEMITYMFMTTPIAVFSIISWIRHPYASDSSEVRVSKLGIKKVIFILIMAVIVTTVFYFILKTLGTANLIISTLSVTTSFLASSLMFFRSPAYALAYSANDIVLIIMWVLASIENLTYIPMIVCFGAFLVNDLYGFYNWRRILKKQLQNA